MEIDELTAWRAAIERTVSSVVSRFEDQYGYPPGDNDVGDPDELNAARLAAIGPAIPRDLLDLYAAIGAVDLPDMGNGLFVHGPGLVGDAYHAHELRRVTGRYHADVIVFASDGGGTLYGLVSPRGSPVYRLPAGRVVNGVYESNDLSFDVVAPTLAGFLDRFLDAVERFAATGEIVDV